MYLLKGFLGDKYQRVNRIIDSYHSVQNNYINMEACCSYPFESVMEAQRYPIFTLPTEGVSGARFFPAFECIEDIDIYSEELVRALFHLDTNYKVSTQPHSGTQANQIVYNAVLSENDVVLSLSPKDGGHISHNKISKNQNKVLNYHLTSEFEFNYDEIERLTQKNKPKLIIVGASSYPLQIDYKRIAQIAHKYNALLLADICHTALYILGKTYPDVFPHADFVTFTMDKTLRGPQGGILIYKSDFNRLISYSIFPTSQGGPLQSIQFAKMIALVELSSIDLEKYAKVVQDNSRIICRKLVDQKIPVVSGTSDTHLILIDVGALKTTGNLVESIFYENNLLVNKNLIPEDLASPEITSGIRLGTVCISNLNYSNDDVILLAEMIANILLNPTSRNEGIGYLSDKYHKTINISN
ncbi:aminotransferase class I/II-fold pyridoxal phosphate-dependent enzyme [Paenibacillus sp. P46E]|uniref:aminotransferase class I/II-fold pyridoxal phosphate-dependent enzyme n=1 Tax=Paenibacillus sp. P46E TaxID=1349436 RepID=UPI000938D316|nr:aminotransferase class I/II-fold pyridoxal phosphate-dependent enzyme [Paenibacillus sp. P46E]OKP95552.1 hypothetical protein A3849_25280 [Paenibacillus sp. P46E]